MPSTPDLELELKLRVPPGAVRGVEQAVRGRSGATRTHLQASYVDTPDRLLAAAGVGWRMRKEGRRWVQTVKADLRGGPDGLRRFEHNVAVSSRTRPAPDASRAIRNTGNISLNNLIQLFCHSECFNKRWYFESNLSIPII